MGFFSSIGSAFARITTAVATGGLSELARSGALGSLGGLRTIARSGGLDALFAPTTPKQLLQSASITAPIVGTALGGPTGGIIANAVVTGIGAGTGQTQPTGPTGGIAPMGLFTDILRGTQGALGGLSGVGGNVGTIANVSSGFLSGFLPAQGPRTPQVFQAPIQQTMAAGPIIQGGRAVASAVSSFAAPILAKMSQALGRNISLRAAMIIIRRLGKFLTSPAAIGAAIGLTGSEVAQLITANALNGSRGRRMNPGNVRALRRAHRRIESFHRLCGKNDTLRTRRRRAAPKTIVVSGKRCD